MHKKERLCIFGGLLIDVFEPFLSNRPSDTKILCIKMHKKCIFLNFMHFIKRPSLYFDKKGSKKLYRKNFKCIIMHELYSGADVRA